MKVILLEDVKKQGKKNDILEVSDGYANNYLIKNKLAVPYSKKSKEVLESELENNRQKEQEEIQRCKNIANQIKKSKLIFFLKSGKNGKAFGTVSSKQISEELKKLGFDIDKKCIHLNEPLDTLGVHRVKIELHKEVVFEVDIQIQEKK